MSIFKDVWEWVKRAFKHIKTDGAKIAVAITEDIKIALNSGAAGALAKVLESVFPNLQHMPEDLLASLQKVIPKVLAAELALQGLPDNPTPEQLLAFETAVMDAFNVHNQKSKVITVLAAQIYGHLQKYVAGPDHTFAELVKVVDAAYADYLADVAAEAPDSTSLN